MLLLPETVDVGVNLLQLWTVCSKVTNSESDDSDLEAGARVPTPPAAAEIGLPISLSVVTKTTLSPGNRAAVSSPCTSELAVTTARSGGN